MDEEFAILTESTVNRHVARYREPIRCHSCDAELMAGDTVRKRKGRLRVRYYCEDHGGPVM